MSHLIILYLYGNMLALIICIHKFHKIYSLPILESDAQSADLAAKNSCELVRIRVFTISAKNGRILEYLQCTRQG